MENKVLAVVNGKEITERQLQFAIERLPQDRKQYFSTEQGKQQLLDQIISFELIYNYAADTKMDATEQYKQQLEIMKKDLLIQVGITEIMKDVQVTDEDIEKYYEENKQMFTKGEAVTAKHILISTEEEAKKIINEIEEGMSFEDAAKTYSSCPSSAQGGNLGNFTKGKMVPEFEKAAFELEVGVISAPVKTQFGYHIIKVEEKQDASLKSLDEVKSTIATQLLQQKENTAFMNSVNELKKKYPVEMK